MKIIFVYVTKQPTLTKTKNTFMWRYELCKKIKFDSCWLINTVSVGDQMFYFYFAIGGLFHQLSQMHRLNWFITDHKLGKFCKLEPNGYK